jgi:nitrogen fixation protein
MSCFGKNVVDEVKKEVKKDVEEEIRKLDEALAKDGKVVSCWGWTVRITRSPKALPPAKLEVTPDGTSAPLPSAPAAV